MFKFTPLHVAQLSRTTPENMGNSRWNFVNSCSRTCDKLGVILHVAARSHVAPMDKSSCDPYGLPIIRPMGPIQGVLAGWLPLINFSLKLILNHLLAD